MEQDISYGSYFNNKSIKCKASQNNNNITKIIMTMRNFKTLKFHFPTIIKIPTSKYMQYFTWPSYWLKNQQNNTPILGSWAAPFRSCLMSRTVSSHLALYLPFINNIIFNFFFFSLFKPQFLHLLCRSIIELTCECKMIT